MSDLQNQTPADTYKGLLQVGDYTDGITNNAGASALQVTDGAGVNTALALSTNRVGVGNNSPQAELDVSGNVVADEYALDQTGTSSSAVAIHAPAPNELAIRTNSTEAMRIDSSGNIGFGTENPAYNLHLANSSSANFLIQKTTAGEQVDGITLNSVGDTGINNRTGDISLIMTDAAGDSEPVLRFSTTNGIYPTKHTMFISDGNVGIGTASPSAPLEVASTTGGVIIPRMNDSQRNAISSPTDGEMIYNTTTNKFQGRANGAWVDFH